MKSKVSAPAVMIAVALVAWQAGGQGNRPQIPLFEPDPLWSQALPNNWVTGQVGGLAVDSHDNCGSFTAQTQSPTARKAPR
jgi:hypothetical protein